MVIYDGKENALRINYAGPQATFNKAYREATTGKVRVEIPEVYELVNIAIAISDYAKREPGAIASTDYADEVRRHFEPYSNHPFIKSVNTLLEKQGKYHVLKMNGAAFDFSASGEVVRSDVYKSIGWDRNILIPLQSEMNDFAQASDFRSFYDEHQALYGKQIKTLRTDIDLQAMLDWLQNEFPDVDAYDTVRVLFSPLVGYNQSLATFDDNGFRELQPHVNFPYPTRIERSDAGCE